MEGPEPGTKQTVVLRVSSHEGSLQVHATPELADVLRLAVVIHRETGKPEHYGFRAILLALVYSHHEISTWFKSATLDTGGIDRSTFLKYGHIQPGDAEAFFAKATAAPTAEDPDPNRTATKHAFAWLNHAHNWASQQGHDWVGLRHLMGAFLFERELYASEPLTWGFERRNLAFKYVAWTEEGLSEADHAFWERAFADLYGREAPPSSPQDLVIAWRLELGRWQPSVLDHEGELWGLGPLERADAGTRVLLVRVGHEPEGLIGIGSVLSEPTPSLARLPHDDATIELTAKVSWTQRDEIPLVPMRRLLSAFPEVAWNRILSGSAIPHEVAERVVASLYSPGPAFPDSLPQIENDGVDGTAHIDIRADVSAIARVMCMRQVKPPLSIALFGNWGSGKSFFMRQLQNKVNEIRTSSWAEGPESAFFSGVVQIEFNAWHYVESNLWASLVFHLFEHLRTTDEAGKADKERAALLNELGAVTEGRVNAVRNLDDARSAEARARRDLVDKQTEAQRKELALQRVSAVDVLAKAVLTDDFKEKLQEAADILGISGIVSSTKEAQSVIEEAKQFEHETSAAVRAFVHAPGLSKRLTWLFLALVAPPCAFAALSHVRMLAVSDWWAFVTKAFSSFVTLVTLATPAVRDALRHAKKAAAALRQAHQSLAAAVKKEEDAVAKETAEAQQALAKATKSVEVAQEDLATADDKVKQATENLLKASPIRILNSFIEERSASDDYRKSLGTMALVRRDFERLSRLLTQARDFRKLGKQADLTPDEQKLAQLPAIDRIILYIDDLDRCPPKQVIEVLQAIHLLLAFELFVVVVGVDPRWVSRSLKKHYPELLAEESARDAANGETSADIARPLDYLEKIFQIPFWLKPIDTGETGTLVRGLLGGDKAQPKAPPPPQPNPAASPAPAPGAPALETPASGKPSTPATPRANPASPAPRTAAPPDDDPPPGPTVVSAEEIDYLAKLGQAR